jgi:queuosine precursor transporter
MMTTTATTSTLPTVTVETDPLVYPNHAFNRAQRLFVWMAGTFLVALIVANMIGGLLVPLPLPWGVQTVTAGIFIFPITFLLTDLLNEYYGVHGARLVTWLGLGMGLLTFAFFGLGEQLTVLPDSPLPKAAFLQVSGQYTGMIFASLAAYLVGQFLDILVFLKFKQLTGNRLLWLRATGSTLVSQLIDSFVVIAITFYDDMPWPQLLAIAWANYQVKFLVSVLITPVLYGGHALIRQYLGRLPGAHFPGAPASFSPPLMGSSSVL